MLKVLVKNALLSMCLGLLYIMLFGLSAQYLSTHFFITILESYLVCAALTTIVMVFVLVAKQGTTVKAPTTSNDKPPLPM